MKISISIFFTLFIITNELIAQNPSDSLYISSIDSIRKKIKKQDNSLIHKQFKDTSYNRTVVKSFENNKLISIFYVNESFICSENVTFHMKNDSLVYVEYTLSAPDIRSSRPARDRKSTRLNSSHVRISYAVFCLKKKTKYNKTSTL